MNSHRSPERILQTALAFWPAKTLLSAVELGVFTTLAQGAQSLESLRNTLKLDARGARDFLDTLVALGFLDREAQTYRNSSDADLFLDKNKPTYIGGMLEMANSRLYPFWGNLTEALRTGKPQSELKDSAASPFETLYAQPERLKEFLSAMTGVSRGANHVIAEQFPWKDHKTFVDVGTAQGDLAVQVARANPHMHGIGFDLPPVAPIFAEYATDNGVSDRVRFQAGDFFKDALPRADVIVMGHILHDWDLQTKQMLIHKAFDALPTGGALIVFEALIDDERRENAFGLMMSLNMLVATPGGFDFTGRDCMSWMAQAGFSSSRIEHLVGPSSMAIAIK